MSPSAPEAVAESVTVWPSVTGLGEATIWLTVGETSPEVATVSGQYFAKCKPKTPKPQALDAEAARRLWEVSEALVADHSVQGA